MTSIIFYILGILFGIGIGYFIFKFLDRRLEKKLNKKLNEGLEKEGYEFLKYNKERYKEVSDEETKPRFDRNAIIRELIGGDRQGQKDTRIGEIKRGVDESSFYQRSSRDTPKRDKIPRLVDVEPPKPESRDGENETRDKPNRWVDI